MRRREFISLLGGAAAWPLAAHAQQPAMPVIGFLETRSPDTISDRLRRFRQGLKDTGYVEGENVTIVHKLAENFDRLSALAAELVRRPVAVIVTPTTPAAIAAKAATTTVPIVFATGYDPVVSGLVPASPDRAVISQVSTFSITNWRRSSWNSCVNWCLEPHMFRHWSIRPTSGMHRSRSPTWKRLPAPRECKSTSSMPTPAARSTMRLPRFCASGRTPFLWRGDGLFTSRRVQLVLLAMLHKVPAIFANREFAEIGGLMSYGANLPDAWHQVGVYVGRILKGEKPADLPVVQAKQVRVSY